MEITDDLKARGVGFRSLTEGFDTTKPAGQLLFHMLAALAEFERGLIAERTRDGMAEGKRQGRRFGAPLFMNAERIKEAMARYKTGESIKEIAESWEKSTQMIYRYIPKAKLRRLRPKNR